jgi:hypothetical protein
LEGDVAPRDGDADGDEEADMINVACVVDEVAANRFVAVGDEAADVAVDGAAAAAGPESIGSGRQRTPPTLMFRWMLRITISVPPRIPKKVERDDMGCAVNSKDPKQTESSKVGEV